LQKHASASEKATALISMMRLPNCFMMGFAVIVGEAIASSVISTNVAFYGFMTGFLLLGSSMVLNDYYDREIDAINEPQRPLPAGRIIPLEAIFFAAILTSIGFLFATMTGIKTLMIAAVSMSTSVAYNSNFKKTGLLGNGLVSANVAVPFIYGGFAVGNPSWTLLIFAILAFLSSLGREIVKGIVDVTGDIAKGVRSVAVIKGNSEAAKQGTAFFLLAVALSALPIAFHMVSLYYVPIVVICDVGFLLTCYSLVTDPTPGNAKRNKKYVLVWMTFGLLAFVIGTL
jgi:geranylgeranylglycerol-phosphate geranylgeranyltransferase